MLFRRISLALESWTFSKFCPFTSRILPKRDTGRQISNQGNRNQVNPIYFTAMLQTLCTYRSKRIHNKVSCSTYRVCPNTHTQTHTLLGPFLLTENSLEVLFHTEQSFLCRNGKWYPFTHTHNTDTNSLSFIVMNTGKYIPLFNA